MCWKKIGLRVALVAVSFSVAVASVEVGLRIFRTELRGIVYSVEVEHAYRIYENPKNGRSQHANPDTKQSHPWNHNLNGFRQAREFKKQKARGAHRVGFFGDSFVENVRMPVQFSFTEPLDFLLNTSGQKTEVLNFGVDGYGTDQVYLQYMDEGIKFDLDTVVYVFCQNDLRDIAASNLFSLSPEGELKYNPKPKMSAWTRFIRKFYLTYFLMEKYGKVKDKTATYEDGTTLTNEEKRLRRKQIEYINITDDLKDMKKAVQIFICLMLEMKKETSKRHKKFLVVFLPRLPKPNAMVEKIVRELGIETFNLYPEYKKRSEDISHFFFRTDPHWNAEGCKLAAECLFEKLSGKKADEKKLQEYYGAFTAEHPNLYERKIVEKYSD